MLDSFDVVLQEELKALEMERTGNEALLIEGDFDAEKDIEVLDRLLGQEVTSEKETLAESEPR